jgi:hypothetical protein
MTHKYRLRQIVKIYRQNNDEYVRQRAFSSVACWGIFKGKPRPDWWGFIDPIKSVKVDKVVEV